MNDVQVCVSLDNVGAVLSCLQSSMSCVLLVIAYVRMPTATGEAQSSDPEASEGMI